jgi:uncharacterized protein YndB with AHSA1/START domain
MRKSEPPIIVEQIFYHPVETVWKVITEHSQMVQWFFDNIPEFKAEVGFETQFNIHNDGRDFMHLWKVTEIIPLERITTHWSFEGYDGEALVSFELTPEGNSTRLRVTNIVLADFDDFIPEFRRESCQSGWEYFIQQRLKDYLRTL